MHDPPCLLFNLGDLRIFCEQISALLIPNAIATLEIEAQAQSELGHFRAVVKGFILSLTAH
jgi:hypothetical protein